jgi:hypothetical protein
MAGHLAQRHLRLCALSSSRSQERRHAENSLVPRTRSGSPHRGEDHKSKSRINPMQSRLRVHRSSRCGALFSCSMCVPLIGAESCQNGPGIVATFSTSGNHGNEPASDAARLPPQRRGRALVHFYCPSERLAMVPRASGSVRSASPVIGRAFRSGSLLHISGLSAWAVASG